MGLIGNFSISATPRLNRFRDDGLAATIIDMDVPNDLFAAPAQLRQRLDLSGERTHQLDREISKIGRAHVWTPVTNAHLVCRLLLEKQKSQVANDTLLITQ